MAWDNNMLNPRKGSFVTVVITVLVCCEVGGRWVVEGGGGLPHRILLDSDVLTDDLFAYFYLLKLNQSEFSVKGITINANTWTDAGHSVNQVYDILYMMDRDDIPVGIGGEGGILQNDTIEPNVGGYLPLIEQGIGTAGYCRYRQHIPVGRFAGRLDINTNYGHRKEFLPRGKRQYSPLKQPTAQQVMIDTISAGPTIVFLMASPTNFAIFLMRNPHLKKNVKHIYMMGGGIRSKNPSGCCPKNATSCPPSPCGSPGNLITYTSNPYAEYNIFGDPFATYQVIHSGIPITLIPLDATNTIPINKEFFDIFEKNQHTYEAQYCFMSLKTVRDTWVDENFYTSYFMWDSFTAGIATSIMKKPNNVNGENEFAEMEYLNITVVTSNEPYGISDGSNPFFDGHKIPRFNLQRNGVHSGHVQTGLRDPFCQGGRCKDAYTPMVTGPEAVQVLVAVKAKPNKDKNSPLNREFFKSFLDVINSPLRSGRFNSTTQFPFHREVLHKPNLKNKKHGTNVVFDMDMSPGDFLALVFLLKLPVEKINLKAIFVTPTGWATAATIDVVYDLLHMMGRDDIPVGLGEVYAMNQSDPNFSVLGDCKYNKVIPSGIGGYLDSDTLYGLGRNLPRSPRRYTAENSVKYGAPRDTEHPELRQPLALEIWNSVVKSLDPGSKLTILTNGPLSTLANIILSSKNMSYIEELIIVGGHIHKNNTEKGNVINFPSNEYAELNMFLDPLAAKVLFNSGINITLVPLDIQRKFSTFPGILQKLYLTKKTPEVLFATSLLSRLHNLRMAHPRYKHMDTFLGEILGAIVLGDVVQSTLGLTFATESIEIHANGIETEDGQMTINEHNGRSIRVLKSIRSDAFYDSFAAQLGKKEQSAVVANFDEQRRLWSTPPNQNGNTPDNRDRVQKKIPSRSKAKKFDGVQD